MSGVIERPKNLIMKEGKLLKGGTWMNFSGEATKYSAAGQRYFNLMLDPESAEGLKEAGWNVKWTKGSEEYAPTPFIKVNISYANKGPDIKIITSESKKVTNITEKTIGMLDYAEIVSVDVNINPYHSPLCTDDFGYSAYLKSMNVYIVEDPIGDMYSASNEVTEE